MVTRSVNEAATVHAQSPIRTVNYLYSLTDARSAGRWPRNAMVTRRVNEEATVHAQSPIRTVNYLVLPHCCSVIWPPATQCNGNPKCKRGSYSTRLIAHPRGQLSGTPSLLLGQLAAGHAMQ
jgi:hypothetical protein